MAALGKDPKSPFGSNATAIGGDATTTGRGMVLGNPHFPWRGRYRFTQQQLTIPGAVRRRRRQPDRLAGGEHRLEQERRLEPHRLDGLPVHAVRVPDAAGTADVPTCTDRRRQAARQARSSTSTVKNADGSLSTVTKNLYRTDAGLRARRPGHADGLDADRASSRSATPTASSCAPSTPSSTWARPPSVQRPARAPGQGRRHAVGEHHRGRPRRQRAVRRPLGRAQRPQRPGPEVHDADRPGALPGGRPARPRRHPRRRATATGAPTPTPSAPASSGRRTCRDRPQRLGDERQRLLLAAQPGAEARGLRADHRLREVPAHPAHPDGRPLRHRRAGEGQDQPDARCAASSTRTG